jgi:hypothetical integral membrane protein (TIGR02206 family)
MNFFDPNERPDELIPMYGTLHLILLIVLPVLILLLIWKKEAIKRLVADRRFMIGLMVFFLTSEALHHIFLWTFKYEPYYERFPLHLCASLSTLLPILILKRKYNLARFFSYWAISAGFISFANPSFQHVDPWSFDFIHYLIRHYFLFLMPVFLQIGLGFKHKYRDFLFSWTGLGAYAILIFLLNWATGANYLYLGQNSPLELPFLPASFTEWPWVLPSFAGTGIILLHIAYFSFRGLERRTSLAKKE